MSWRCEGCGGTGEYLVTHPYDPDMNHYAECAFCEGTGYDPDIPEATPILQPVVLTAEGIGKSIEAVAEEVDKLWEVVNLLYEIHQSELKWHRGEFRSAEAAE